MKKLMALFLTLVLAVGLFAGCGSKDEEKEQDNDTTTAGEDTVVDLSDFEDAVVFTVNDEEVMLSSANILVYQIKSYYESMYGPTVWDMDAAEGLTVEQFVKDDIEEITVRTTVLFDHAAKNGWELDAAKEEELVTQAGTIYESYAPEVLSAYGITLENLEAMLVRQGVSEVAFEELTKDTEIDEELLMAEMEKNQTYNAIMELGVESYYDQVRARHILIKTVDDANQPYSEEDYAKALETINEIRDKALAGDDFAELATEFTEDPGSKETGGEYTFGRGRMVAEFEEAAFGLDEGGISEVVETQYGFHVIKLEEKIPSTEEQVAQAKEELNYIRQDAEYVQKIGVFDTAYEEILKDYTVVINNEVWDAVALRDAVEESEADTSQEAAPDSNE